MIESIKLSNVDWYQKEIKNNFSITESQIAVPKSKIDTEKLVQKSKDYFYTDKYKEDISKEAWQELEISAREIDYLASRGYEIEHMTMGEISSLSVFRQETRLKENTSSSKVDKLKEHTDSMYIYAMNSTGKLSINDLYKGSFSGAENKNKTSYKPNQIQDILKLNNIEATQGNQWAVSKLLSLGLDVSQDDVIKIQNIKSAVDSLETNEDSSKVLVEDEKILYVEKDIQEIIDEITAIDEEDIRANISEGKEITIGNLRETMHQNTEKALKTSRPNSKNLEAKELAKVEKLNGEEKSLENQEAIETQVEHTKEQLKEIRARLNVEAAIKVSEKMPLESTELSKVAKALIEIEDTQIDQAIQKAEIEPTIEVKDLIKDTLRATHMIAKQKEVAAIVEHTSEVRPTLAAMSKVLNTYEENALKVEERFGETIAKVEGQIEETLKINGVAVTKENIEAAKALVSNGLEINQKQIEEVAKMINKMDVFLEEMTPERAALLIKEGLNPYKSSINNILEWIGLTKLPALKGSVAEAIVGLSDSKQISDSQKESLVGLYRIIGTMVKSKEKVIGYMFKNELPLTIEKLEEATRYARKEEHIAVKIDNEFGELETLKYEEATARTLIEEATKENNKLLDIMKVLENTQLPIDKENISKLTELNSLIFPFIKTEVKKALGKFEGINSLAPSTIEKLNVVKAVSKEVLEVMGKQNITPTISNIYWMQKLVEAPHLYSELVKEHNLIKENFPETIEEVEADIEKLHKAVSLKKETSIEKGDLLGYKGYKQLEEIISVQKQLIEKERLYQIPFVINGEARVVNLYIPQKDKAKNLQEESLNAVITYDTKELGTVVAKLQIEKDKINYTIQGASTKATNQLRRSSKQLDKMLETIGYLINRSEYETSVAKKAVINPEQSTKHSDSSFEEVV